MGAIQLSIVELHSASYTLDNSLGTIYTIRKKENVDVSQIEMSEEPQGSASTALFLDTLHTDIDLLKRSRAAVFQISKYYCEELSG